MARTVSDAPPSRNGELIAVAARLFRERGYEATSMQEIANEMGILKGSLYHYVRTKEDLLWMIVEPTLTELTERAERILTDETTPLGDRIAAAISAHATSYELHYPHMFVITRENGETLSPARRAAFLGLRVRYFTLWKQAIAGGIASGELDDTLDPLVTVEAIFGMVSWMHRWFRPGGRLSAADVAGQFSKIVVGGIVAEPVTTPGSGRRSPA